MTPYEEDRAWADQFLPHQKEIAEKAIRVEMAPIEDDLRRNTDLILRSVVRGKRLEDIRISARVRRHGYIRQYRDDFTIRLDRPSGAQAEMPKLRAGYGDFFIYGFESEPGSDRMSPWFIGNSALLRDYLNSGGYFKVEQNEDRSSRLAVVNLADMPLGFVLDSEGLTVWDSNRIWERCRKCWWWRNSGGLVMPLDEEGQPGDGYWRKCIACGFKWRAGWVMSLTKVPEVA